jgi:restriction endonuclease
MRQSGRNRYGSRKRTYCVGGLRIGRPRGGAFPLFEDFDGELLYYPEIIPIALNFGRIISEVKSKPTELFFMSPRRFEELVAEIWRRFGYCVELTSQTRDGGRDIIAVKQAEVNVRFLIECKRYERRRKVGVEMVRSLYGVKMDECATKAILATTSSFSPAAKEFFKRHIWELEPRDYDGVVDWIKLATLNRSL